MIRLSDHFTLEELTFSDYGQRHGVKNEPSPFIVENLQSLALLLERVREIAGQPLIVNSGYRSERLNRLLGGVVTSAHVDGRAADFRPVGGDCRALAKKLAAHDDLVFDQLILEYGWIHIAQPPRLATPRQQCLTKAGARSPYTEGIA